MLWLSPSTHEQRCARSRAVDRSSAATIYDRLIRLPHVVEPRKRLRSWADDWSPGRFERPTYKNPGELKADIRLVLDALDEAEEAIRDASE